MKTRSLTYVKPAEAVTDGDGVRIWRNVARGHMAALDPFLLLDEICSDDSADYIGGFPEHPHRGFETVTYMLEGSMGHRDHMGNEGLLKPGSVQWMTAGRGVLHSEMPMQEDGLLHGFQLWVNLPAVEKMSPPNYREYSADQIPRIEFGRQSQLKVIAGSYQTGEQTLTGPVTGVSTKPLFFDIQLAKGDSLLLPVTESKRVLIYLYQGELDIDGRALKQQQLGQLTDGGSLNFTALLDSRFLLLAGEPLNEPVANWGPFVMNTREEIEQAITDFQNGTFV